MEWVRRQAVKRTLQRASPNAKDVPGDSQRAGAQHDRNNVPFPAQHSNECNCADDNCEPIDGAVTGKKRIDREPHREVHHDAHNRGRDRRERGREPDVTAQFLDVRAAQENPKKTGCERDSSCKKRADGAGQYW